MNKNSGGTVTSTKTYYPAGGAMRVDGTRYYVLKDHLGSASVVTNQSATTVGEDRFYPFGETRFTTGNMQTDKLFTGQREITGLGIYDYGARYYSPKLGRFLSADTIVPGFANPQNLNRFSYVRNNPLRYIDPTGHRACDNYDAAGRCITTPGGGGSGFGGLPKPQKDGGNNGGSGGNSGAGGGSDPQTMETSAEGVNFIKHWEDDEYAPYPYPDAGKNCTIGWGHFLQKNGCSGMPNKTWYYDKDDPHPLSSTQAEKWFKGDTQAAENTIKDTITVPLTQPQFDALVSYIFNAGKGKYEEKKIPELINSGNIQGAADAIGSGPNDSGGIELDKLKERRHAEEDLFLNGNYVP